MNERIRTFRFPPESFRNLPLRDRSKMQKTVNLAVSNTVRRGLFHIFAGLCAVLTGLFLPRPLFLILLGAAVFILVAGELARFASPRLNAWFCRQLASLLRDAEVNRVTGSTYLAIGVLLTFLAFDKNVAALAISFLAVGDPMGSMIGSHLGKLKFRGKTLEGCLACLVSSAGVGLVFYYLGLDVRLLTVLVGAVVATFVEALHLPVNDNLAIPLSAGLVMSLLQI
ncbi:MAG: hypothetical protein HYX79_11045 [Chloroflexi bacterium]|nr:hypothetical protein [Chloroflexota bacterium]